MEQLCLCVVSGSGRRARCDLFLMQIYRTQLANTRPTSWKLHPIAHSLPFFPKELSCCVTMEIHDCWCWNALIIMGEKKPYTYKLSRHAALLFLLIQFSVSEQEKGKTQNLLRFVEASWCNFKQTSNKRGSSESCWRGEYPSEQEGQRVKEQMVESMATWSTTINKHKTQIWSVYSKTTLLTLRKTTKQQGLFSHGTDLSQSKEKGKSKYTPTQT